MCFLVPGMWRRKRRRRRGVCEATGEGRELEMGVVCGDASFKRCVCVCVLFVGSSKGDI